jgi:hypothetical protein
MRLFKIIIDLFCNVIVETLIAVVFCIFYVAYSLAGLIFLLMILLEIITKKRKSLDGKILLYEYFIKNIKTLLRF